MPFSDNEARHSLTLTGRSALCVSGVEEVESFDDTAIVMRTALGTLIIRGEELHIEALSLEGGELKVTGSVDALAYEDAPRPGGLFARLFRP